LLLTAAFAVPALAAGCQSYYDDYYYPRYRQVEYRRTVTPAPNYAAAPAPAPTTQPSDVEAPQPPAAANAGEAQQGLGAPPLADTSGIRLTDLPAVRRAMDEAKPWQEAEKQIADRIDGPDLRQNLHEGMAALAPRVARALMDYRGDIAVVTVAVYQDKTPALPSTQPAAPSTQPVYRDAAIALAFEGFGKRLEATFLPRVLADQPRSPDDGRQPVDPNLALDKGATSYIVYRLTRDGLLAGFVSHEDHRQPRAAAAAPPPPPSSRPAVPQTEPDGVANFAPNLPGPIAPDYGTDRVIVEEHYVYSNGSYWGPTYDPYLYDLYGCRWGYGGFYSGGFLFGSGPWFYHRNHGWHDRGHDWHHNGGGNNNGGRPGRGGIVTSGGTRGTVPWLRPPIVSPVNPSATAIRGNNAPNVRTGRATPSAVTNGNRSTPAVALPRDIAATPGRTAVNSGNSPAAVNRPASNGTPTVGSDGKITYRATRGGPTVTYVPNTPAARSASNDDKSDDGVKTGQLPPRLASPGVSRTYTPAADRQPTPSRANDNPSRGAAERSGFFRGNDGNSSRGSASGSNASNGNSRSGGGGGGSSSGNSGGGGGGGSRGGGGGSSSGGNSGGGGSGGGGGRGK
jgi:hypothetical protein